jgi:threonine dehydratase
VQPIGSFKLRGAYNAARRADPELVSAGLITASAGNMGQGVAWAAKELGVPCTVVVPDYAPETKVSAMERFGARVVKKPFDEWWEALEESRLEGVDGLFLHPVENESVMAGNGTIGLEILEDLPDPDLVLIPFGGGGLTTGIASAIKQERPETKIYCVEQDTAAPLNATLEAGSMQAIDYQVSFVDGAGAKALLPKMWGLVEPLIDGAHRVSLDEVASAIRVLAERVRVIAEGAGALAPAVALSGRAGNGKIVCVVSGGNIDFSVLSRILAGETP